MEDKYIIDNKIKNILKKQDMKIERYLATRDRTHFFYASYPMEGNRYYELVKMHSNGFDNYPQAEVVNEESIFFIEKLIGCHVTHIGGKKDFFHTYCSPCIQDARDIGRIKPDLDNSKVWKSYFAKLEKYTLEKDILKLPLCIPSFSLLDCACSICGTENLFTLMYDDENSVKYLLDIITGLYLECIQRIKGLGIRMTDPYGFPGTYCNDLQLMNLSPVMIERFILPQYEKVAEACGGMIFSINFSDSGLAREFISIRHVIGAAFDQRFSFEEIKRILNKKLFVIHHYMYRDEYDRPTLENGVYCNPIVQTHSRELEKAWQALSPECSMLVSIERHDLSRISSVRKELLEMSHQTFR